MALSEKKATDAVVQRDGVEFFIDNESAQYLRDATLDFRDGLTGVGFQIVNPNASRTCGCGSSFEAAQPA
jgi:iron-sulfur cluster assembly protein